MTQKLPIGIQSFEKIREDGFLYVDKTKYVFDLVHNNVPYFLSRPRRFGKSLLLSTMKAYWEGKKGLFAGLELEQLEVEIREYIYLFEFKRDDTADAALEQIDSKDYALSFAADHRKIFKIGVSFDSATRKLSGWKTGI